MVKTIEVRKSKRQGEIPPLGIRCNNPLNIRRSKSQWHGQTNWDSNDSFCKFSNLYYGWRAALIIIASTYYNRGWRSLRLIIQNWAPYTENDTDGYLAFVSKFTGIKPDTVLPKFYAAPGTYRDILVAMAKMECGIAWIGDKEVLELVSVINYVNINNSIHVR